MDRTRPRAEDVIAHVDTTWGAACLACRQELIGHDAVIGLMLGFANEPLCGACLAERHGREPLAFIESARRNVARLACYRAGWRHADARLAAQGPWPEARLPSRLRMAAEDDEHDEHDDEFLDSRPLRAQGSELSDAVAASDALEEWDAGDRGCGELALELKLRFRRLPPGARLLLHTTDSGAPADLPAWCRLTGNSLVAADPPRFLIECAPRADRP